MKETNCTAQAKRKSNFYTHVKLVRFVKGKTFIHKQSEVALSTWTSIRLRSHCNDSAVPVCF